MKRKLRHFSDLSRLKFLAASGSVICSLLLSSCSNDSLENEELNNLDEPQQTFELVSNEGTMLELNGVGGLAEAGKATTAAGNDNGRFNISLSYTVPVTDRQREVFEAAAARWERIIIKDVPSFTGIIPSAFLGFPPVVDGTLDDIVIEVALTPIDGPGKILGSAGPRYARTEDYLTLSGLMRFDTADLAYLDELDLFEEVIVHEMGHVLGVGTLWNYQRALRQGPASNPYFTGKMANTFWNAEGGLYELPVENMGGPGTAGGHWRESILRNELMTGYLNLGENPLSRITAGSMSDLGYGAAMVGEQYELRRDAEGVEISELAKMGPHQGLHIAAMETILEPIGLATSSQK